MTHVHDFIIAGAGPAGLTAAALLTRYGFDVVVLEADDALSTEGRASTFHPPTLEALEELGVADDLIALGLKAPTFQYRRQHGGLIAEFDLSVLATETKYPYRLQCEQSLLTPLLQAVVDQAGREVRFGHRAEGVRQPDTDLVELDVRLPDGGMETMGGRWLIGGDGAHSVVRHQLNLQFEGETVSELFLVIATDEDLKTLVPGISYVNYVVDPVRWSVLLRTQAYWRILVPLRQKEPTVPDMVAVAREQLELLGSWTDGLPIKDTGLYRVHQRVSERFGAGNVALVGDAAHINNPLGGMGMNSAIHDAYFLAHLLADVLHGRAEPEAVGRLLDDRRSVFVEHVQRQSEGNWERLREPDPRRRADSERSLKETAEDPRRAKEFLYRSSLLAAARASGLGAAGRS